MFYRYEHYMSISHIALIVNMVQLELSLNPDLRAIGLMCRVFANGPGDRGSTQGRVILKT